MRRSTPTKAIREATQVKLKPTDPDPAYPDLMVEDVQADHIVPMNTLRKLPGFAMLDEPAQLAILNMPANFAPMSRRVNASRGDASWAEWKGWNRRPPDPEFLATMRAAEEELLVVAQQRVDAALRAQMAAQ